MSVPVFKSGRFGSADVSEGSLQRYVDQTVLPLPFYDQRGDNKMLLGIVTGLSVKNGALMADITLSKVGNR